MVGAWWTHQNHIDREIRKLLSAALPRRVLTTIVTEMYAKRKSMYAKLMGFQNDESECEHEIWGERDFVACAFESYESKMHVQSKVTDYMARIGFTWICVW